jgi:hypothetical protein
MAAILEPDDYYLENGLMVLTERYHLKRGSCCGNGCRHCPYDHEAVPRGPEGARNPDEARSSHTGEANSSG